MNSNLLIDGFRSFQLVLEKKQPTLTKEMLLIDRESELSKDEFFPEAVQGTSYDVMTPLNLKRSHIEQKNISLNTSEHKRQNIESIGQIENKTDTVENHLEERRRHNREDINIKDKNILQGESRSERGSPGGHGESRSERGYPGVQNSTANKDLDKDSYTKSISGIASSFQNKKHSRREQILNLFVKGVDIGIKDITARVKGCSEKTIQRELNNLVFDKKLNRIGEKRWSRYVLR